MHRHSSHSVALSMEPVVAGKDLEAAVFAIEELEETVELALLLRGCGARLLTREQIADVVTYFNVEWDD